MSTVMKKLLLILTAINGSMLDIGPLQMLLKGLDFTANI
jgi:hypothetical protein